MGRRARNPRAHGGLLPRRVLGRLSAFTSEDGPGGHNYGQVPREPPLGSSLLLTSSFQGRFQDLWSVPGLIPGHEKQKQLFYRLEARLQRGVGCAGKVHVGICFTGWLEP